MSRQTVLLLDSHADSRAIYSAILRHHGFDVVEAGCFDEGVRVARERRPDVVVLEIAARRTAGLDAARRLRADPATAAVPILGLGTAVHPGDHERALAAGCTRYLLKPCPPVELLAACRSLLGPS